MIMNNTDHTTLITNETELEKFRHFIQESIKEAKIVKIASGYVGMSAFLETAPALEALLKKGGQVTLIFGLGYWEGISPSLEKKLREFHQLAQELNKNSGIFFCQKQRFHGKIYFFQNNQDTWASAGSSNFSDTGFGNWLEANFRIYSKNETEIIDDYFERLKTSNAKGIDLLSFPSRKKELKNKVQKANIAIPKNILDQPISFKLQIKPEPQSHVNLFAGAGRKNKKGIYILRPWYEVEIGVSKSNMNSLRKIVPAQKSPFKIKLVDDVGDVMPALFKRKSAKKDSSNTLLDGADFMTSNRVDLGRFIKDILIDSGLLKYGELINQDTLDIYGNHFLEFRAIPNKKGYYYIKF
jgi:HKD family nuclease